MRYEARNGRKKGFMPPDVFCSEKSFFSALQVLNVASRAAGFEAFLEGERLELPTTPLGLLTFQE